MPDSPMTKLDEAIGIFSKEQPKYQRFAEYVCKLVGHYCGKELIHTTQYRAKTVDSFAKKCKKIKENGEYRYPNPLNEITDLAGVRVIVFVRDSVDHVCNNIGSIFNVLKIEDVGERVYSQGKFGYQSKHLLIRLGDDRQSLVENIDFSGLVCEIQVRTILQHAWAEMEHDIQYKSDQEIPIDLKKRFSALAGLLELGDREFQSIQTDSENLRQAVKDELISDLTQQGLTEKGEITKTGDSSSADRTSDARELVRLGRYPEAIEIYSEKIAQHPLAHTLYIGRAKSKFLAGDMKGAVADLNHVEELTGNTYSTAYLRAMVETGDARSVAGRVGQNDKIASGLEAATKFLRGGEGVKAFDEYNQLESYGYNKAFSLFGKAMSCTLERDVDGAKEFLQTLKLRPATPMAVNICALRNIIDILERKDTAISSDALDAALQNMPNFTFEASPLKAFLTGILAKSEFPSGDILIVFRKIGATVPEG